MSPKGFDPSVLAAWLWWRPSLKAFGAHLRLPSPREVIILCCVLVTLHTVATAARQHIATRPPRRWNLPVRTASAIPYGVPPPSFQAVDPDGLPYTQDSLPSDGLALRARPDGSVVRGHYQNEAAWAMRSDLILWGNEGRPE